jgi:hypothetical protein
MSFTFSTSDGTLLVDRTDKALTTNGGFAAFASFLNRSQIIDKLIATCPIERSSNNALPVRDVIISFLLTCIVEGRRFRHVRFIQNDAVIAKLFKLERRICSDDTFRRFFAAIDNEAGKKWLDGAFEILFSALPQMFIIDWDSTVTTRYGEQEGVEVGYNPMKPGRGSHHPLIATVAGLRMCLTLSLRPGNSHTADGMTAAMEDLLSRLPENRRPYITRADIGFSGEPTLKWFETGGGKPYYVFKLKKSARVMEAVRAVSDEQWEGATTFGAMQLTEVELALTTWEKPRRIILGRRLVNKQTPEESGTLFGVCAYEYSAFVTNLSKDQFDTWQVVELYQGRADCENVFDELKNQWGLSGFCSQQLQITELAARFTVLSYNIWSLFVRFFGGKNHKEAQTSRREILMFPAQLTESGRERTLQISVADQFWDVLNLGYERLIKWLKATAPQLTRSCALIDWIKAIDAVSSPGIPDLSPVNCGI